MTIYEIKRLAEENGSHFFDRNTMKFFGQTLKDFHVYKTDNENIYRLTAKRKYGQTEVFFNIITKSFIKIV